jgi:ATP-dependent exoDNAse (exonuclease V) alpha subunit
LSEIHRQREAWRREAVHQFSRGEAKEALISYAAHDQLHVTTTRDEAMLKLVELWKAGKGHLREHAKETFILAPLNCEVDALNELCQKERLKAGQLGERAMKIGKWEFHEGDRVLLTKRDVKLGVENGFMGEVVSFDEGGRTITVRLDKQGRVVELPLEEYGADHCRLGYSATVHKSQGSTRETVHVLLGSHMMDQHLSYVSASRSRGETHLVCDHAEVAKDPTLKDAIRTLARAMSRDRTKDLAHDILSPPVRPTPAHEQEQEQRRRAGISLGL